MEHLSITIAATSVGFAILMGVLGLRRNNKHDDRNEATLLTTMSVKLDEISKNVGEIKRDVKDVNTELKNHSERLVCVEQQVKVLNNKVFKDKGA